MGSSFGQLTVTDPTAAHQTGTPNATRPLKKVDRRARQAASRFSSGWQRSRWPKPHQLPPPPCPSINACIQFGEHSPMMIVAISAPASRVLVPTGAARRCSMVGSRPCSSSLLPFASCSCRNLLHRDGQSLEDRPECWRQTIEIAPRAASLLFVLMLCLSRSSPYECLQTSDRMAPPIEPNLRDTRMMS